MATPQEPLSSVDRGLRRPLRVGTFLPTLSGIPPGTTLGWREHLALAQAAEAVGCDAIWVCDELHYWYPDAPSMGWWECWTFLSAIAAATERAGVGTLVSCTNYRNPALLAKMATTVDEISGGRLTLGLGSGWSEYQFRTFGFPTDHAVGRFEESLQVIRALLREGRVSFDGQYYQAQDATLLPAGPRPGRIPIMVGGTGPRVLGLAARYADAWNVFLAGGDCSPARALPHVAALEAACAAAGRDPATIKRSASVIVALSDEPLLLGTHDWAVGALRGSVIELADQLRAFADAGIDEVQACISPPTTDAIEQFGRVLEELESGA
jgi:alkanesulfonate monooxygenase SsuD/methylene tetrahydromethanopterin reductase-like flavin-dependent oxidoreductase (luciferase family)